MEPQTIITYYPNGNICEEFTIVDGLVEGKYRKLYESGLQFIEGECKYGKFNGNFTFYAPDGLVQRTCTFDNGHLTGCVHEYEGNQLITQTDFLDGKLHGVFLAYSKTGVLQLRSEYAENMKNGTTIVYNDKGRKIKSEQYHNEVLHGITIVYFEDGTRIKEKIQYNIGKLHGECIQYNSMGVVTQKLYFDNGKKLEYNPDKNSKQENQTGILIQK